MTQRYFVETKQAFKAEELKLQKEFSRILKHDIGAVRLIQVYDVLGETVDKHQLYDELTQTITQDMELSNPHFAYEALEGHPVTIRFLDPPLHEFVPTEEADIEALAKAQGKTVADIKAIINSLHEFNPMMGHRGGY